MTDHERLMEIENRAAKATAGDWSECSAPNCKCTAIMSKSDVVAEVTRGKWGDDFPTIKLERGDGIAPIAVAVMEQITYGEVSDEQFLANRAFISHSKADIPWLTAQLRAAMEENARLREALTGLEGANESACALRSEAAYLALIACPGMSDALVVIDRARHTARVTLHPPEDSTGEPK